MNIVIAMDSFKGTMTSMEAGSAVKEGILRADPHAEVTVCPLADGGEGTVAALAEKGKLIEATVSGPWSTPVQARYCILPSGTAVIEISAAAGLPLVPEEKRDPLYTTTYGVGELILHAINEGCRHFIVGIGGSATNDGGAGMLSALGFDLLDGVGAPIPLGAIGLKHLTSISAVNVHPALKECSFRIACDVTNPLCGENGCSAVFSPQKGATPESIPLMDQWLAHYAHLVKQTFPHADQDLPGAGAAGGLGFAFAAFANATLESGVNIILEETQLEKQIQSSDLIITGEGRLDGQTAMGKAPIGVARLAKKHGKKVIAFAGSVTEDAYACHAAGIDAFFPTLRRLAPLEETLAHAYPDLADTTYEVFRLIRCF